jgi:hypothetical protein
MDKELFDNYRFSIRTEVNISDDVWEKVTEVFFKGRKIGVERGYYLDYTEIKHIRESGE